MRHLIGFVLHPHLTQHLIDTLVDVGLVLPTRGLKHKQQVVVDRAVRQQLEILEHHTNLPSQHRHVLAADGRQVVVEDSRLAHFNRHFGIHRLHQAALTASDTAYQIHELTFLKLKVHVFQHEQLLTEHFHIFIINDC